MGFEILPGIVGGLGPKASAIFYDLNIVEQRVLLHNFFYKHRKASLKELKEKLPQVSTAQWTDSEILKLQTFSQEKRLKDQDHPPVLIYGNTQIPERPNYIIGVSEESPVPEMALTVKRLLNGGATSICVTCNTAHYFVPDTLKYLKEKEGIEKVNFIDMLQLTFEFAKRNGASKIGLIATDGSIKTKIFHKKAAEVDESFEILTTKSIERFNEAIHGETGVKAGFTGEDNAWLIVSDLKELFEAGCFSVILGCTELPLLLTDENFTALKKTHDLSFLDKLTLINPSQILGDELLRQSLSSRT